MTWNGNKVRELRLRIGWSQAEMARQLGCDIGLIRDWEFDDAEIPFGPSLSLTVIHHSVEANSENVSQRALSQVVMKNLGVCQIDGHDLRLELKKQSDLS
jgi:transcriptional regulator with XRE-family HTH domain